MPLSASIRDQIMSGFRAELAEHVQTMNDGLLALEQHRVNGSPRRSLLEDVFRAAHSLKGAARAVGLTSVEQLAHALEDVLASLQHEAVEPSPELYTACYRALDTIQAVQANFESGQTTVPAQALQALSDLEPFRPRRSEALTSPVADSAEAAPPAAPGLHTDAGAAPLAVRLAPPGEPARVKPRDKSTSSHSTSEPAAAPADFSSPAAGASSAPGGEETIRVSVAKLDALMAQLSELLVTKIRAAQRLAHLRQAQQLTSQWQKEWLAVRSVYSLLARNGKANSGESPLAAAGGPGDGKLNKEIARVLSYVSFSQERLREMSALINTLSREFDNDTMHTALVIDALEQEIKRVRMLPLGTITGTFGRMVRDLAQAAGKEAVLDIEGAEVELDKRVLEQIKDPLIHLVRNAIDHGLEAPARREALGKPRAGKVTLTAEQLGKDVVICVTDDGSGLDVEAIRRAAMRRGGPNADPQALSEADLSELIFTAGFTTSPIITDVSGRGVGLDVVRRNVEALNGRINVAWTPGAGSTFTLILPLTLTSSRGLLVRVAGELFAIPLNSVERILRLAPEEIAPLGGHDTVRYDGRPLLLVRLGDVLELPPLARPKGDPDRRLPVVVLAAAERRAAFAVDELAGEQEVVIKTLGKQLLRVGGIAGATVMGSGEVTLILNVADLIKLATRGERRSVLQAMAETISPEAAGRSRKRILVVDDSITTRTLEKNILEAAGYKIELATDGQEALGVIASGGVPDLVISDIVMPRLDGFGLTQRLKGDARTASMPVVLVTSLDSAEDKARGIQVGADAYITKSRFDQNNLIETIEQLI